MTNGFNLQTFVQPRGGAFSPPSILAAPPVSNGGGGFFQEALAGAGGFGGILQTGLGIFQEREETREARKVEKAAAVREFELEKFRIQQASIAPPPISPPFPVSLPTITLPEGSRIPALPPGIPPVLFLGGAALLLFGLMKRGRR